MTVPSDALTLTARLALLSSISFGGFPTVLPDVREFVVASHGWLTDQEFSNLFALAQAILGPNIILMMSFVGLHDIFRVLLCLGSFSRNSVAEHC